MVLINVHAKLDIRLPQVKWLICVVNILVIFVIIMKQINVKAVEII